jgi:hypothetical protein
VEKVTLKAKNKHYEGFVRGFRFKNGEALDVPLKDAEIMEKSFGVYIVKPEQPKEEEKPKVKRSARKKKGE